MKKFYKLYSDIKNNLKCTTYVLGDLHRAGKNDGNKQTGFEIPQYDGSLTEYSADVLAGKNPTLDKNKKLRVDLPNKQL